MPVAAVSQQETKMFPTKIILRPREQQQRKALIIRNPTSVDMIVKLYSAQSGVVPSRPFAVVQAGSSIEVPITFVLQKAEKMSLLVFARGVFDHNLVCLKKWVSDDPATEEKKSRLAFKLSVVVSENEFSAPNIILDLPAGAALVEAEEFSDDEEEDAGVATAEKFSSRLKFGLPSEMTARQQTPQVIKKEENTKESENCTILRYLLDTIYPPVAGKA